MIVKNEEKTLDRCLSSLKPLMEAVESELIITDTGSTDSTVEIAKKYTDHIIHFEWCDDFSAARNTGLKEARGEWFMFLDGDEWFENTDELIEFFTSGECDKYGSVSYIIRNYFNLSGNSYRDFNAMRVLRDYPGVCFSGIVHETIPFMQPIKFVQDYAHHYGYAFQNIKEKMKKSKRNMDLLLKTVNDNPDDYRAYRELANEYFGTGEMDLVEECCKFGLEAEKKNPNRASKIFLNRSLVRAKYFEKRYGDVLEVVDAFFCHESHHIEIPWLDFYYMAQASAYVKTDYEHAVFYGNAYLDVWEKYQSGQLDKTMLLYEELFFVSPIYKANVLHLLAQTYLFMNDVKSAESVIDQLDFQLQESFSPMLRLVSQLCEKINDWGKLVDIYQKIAASQIPNRTALLTNIESVLLLDETDSAAAAAALASIPWDRDAYVRLCRLRSAEQRDDRTAVLIELNWFFQWDGEWNTIFSDVIYYAMKETVNLMPLISKIDMDDLKFYAAKMNQVHSDFLEIIHKYFNSYSFDSTQGVYWEIVFREKILLSKDNPFETESEEIEVFKEYARQSAKYVRALYRPELLLSDRIAVLPRAHRFGYYMGLALSARDKDDDQTYLANLRLALDCYPVMKWQISLLLEQFEKEEKLRMEKAEEFNVLAAQVKKNIQDLISQGNLKEAGRYTVQLAALLPNDPDVVKFRTITHTEPDMNELAARLPQ
ncbi:glycosyltransferase [Caproicibacter sp.]|uniref:tetratricopeptide repeat-containing glycosyltransferase family 2 protein n=1 Tax=Caproicibacter sp. TaxID=2814884 RepID=UPI0039899AC5